MKYMELIQSGAYQILSIVIQICIILAAGFIVYLIRKLAEYVGIKTDSSVMQEIERTVLYIVKRENQKVVDHLKELSPDGKLTDDQKKKIYDEVYDNVVSSLTKAQKEIIEKSFPTMEEGIEYIIEYMVNTCHTSVIVSDPCFMEDCDDTEESEEE